MSTPIPQRALFSLDQPWSILEGCCLSMAPWPLPPLLSLIRASSRTPQCEARTPISFRLPSRRVWPRPSVRRRTAVVAAALLSLIEAPPQKFRSQVISLGCPRVGHAWTGGPLLSRLPGPFSRSTSISRKLALSFSPFVGRREVAETLAAGFWFYQTSLYPAWFWTKAERGHIALTSSVDALQLFSLRPTRRSGSGIWRQIAIQQIVVHGCGRPGRSARLRTFPAPTLSLSHRRNRSGWLSFCPRLRHGIAWTLPYFCRRQASVLCQLQCLPQFMSNFLQCPPGGRTAVPCRWCLSPYAVRPDFLVSRSLLQAVIGKARLRTLSRTQSATCRLMVSCLVSQAHFFLREAPLLGGRGRRLRRLAVLHRLLWPLPVRRFPRVRKPLLLRSGIQPCAAGHVGLAAFATPSLGQRRKLYDPSGCARSHVAPSVFPHLQLHRNVCASHATWNKSHQKRQQQSIQ